MTYSNYSLGCDAALIKLGVSPKWVSQKVLNSYKKGITPERAERFAEKMRQLEARVTAPGLLDNYGFAPLATPPKTEIHPIRPDIDWDYYTDHNHALSDKAYAARTNLDAFQQHWPNPADAPKTIVRAVRDNLNVNIPKHKPARRVLPHLSGLRHKYPTLSDEQIDNFAMLNKRGPISTGHPRTDYLMQLLDLDATQEAPRSRLGRDIKRHLKAQDIAQRRKGLNSPLNAGHNTATPATVPTPATAAAPPSNLLRNSLIGAGAIGIPTAGYTAYQHFNKKEPRE